MRTPPGLRWTHAAALFALLVVAVAWPALGGEPVYDDRLMIDHPAMDGLDDVRAVFERNSDHYIGHREGAGPAFRGVPTYRPLPMLSLIAVNALAGVRWVVHHLVSLIFHLGAVVLAARLLARDGRLPWPAFALVGAFAVHPALAEAWQWINGRSDAMAGLALLGMAATLRSPARGAAAATAAIAVAGALCKIAFLPAAAVLVVAAVLPGGVAPAPFRAGAPAGRAVGVRGGLALAAATLVYVAGRGATLSPDAVAAGATPVDPRALIERGPALLATGAETLLLPAARPMRLLAWELADPWAPGWIAALGLAVAGIAWLAIRRRWGALVTAIGAGGVLLPAVWVADGFWLGLDRYLYLPACLLLLGLGPLAAEVRRGPWKVAAPALTLAVAVPCRLTATTYTSHVAFARSMIDARPADPTGYVLLADEVRRRGRADAAREILARLPPGPYPPPVAHAAARTSLAVGRARDAARIIEAASAHDPDHPGLRFDLLALRAAQGRWDEAVDLARGPWPDAHRRRAVRALLRSWLRAGRVPPARRAIIESLASGEGSDAPGP